MDVEENNDVKKRKREPEPSRITYHTPTKTFERIFKETSLDETKQVVRRKLGLDPATPIELAQLREGKVIALEDDEDFAAFCVLCHSIPCIEVRVTIGDESATVHPATATTQAPPQPEKNSRPGPPDVQVHPRKKQKISFKDDEQPVTTTAGQDTSLPEDEPLKKKRRKTVPDSDAPDALDDSLKKPKRKRILPSEAVDSTPLPVGDRARETKKKSKVSKSKSMADVPDHPIQISGPPVTLQAFNSSGASTSIGPLVPVVEIAPKKSKKKGKDDSGVVTVSSPAAPEAVGPSSVAPVATKNMSSKSLFHIVPTGSAFTGDVQLTSPLYISPSPLKRKAASVPSSSLAAGEQSIAHVPLTQSRVSIAIAPLTLKGKTKKPPATASLTLPPVEGASASALSLYLPQPDTAPSHVDKPSTGRSKKGKERDEGIDMNVSDGAIALATAGDIPAGSSEHIPAAKPKPQKKDIKKKSSKSLVVETTATSEESKAPRKSQKKDKGTKDNVATDISKQPKIDTTPTSVNNIDAFFASRARPTVEQLLSAYDDASDDESNNLNLDNNNTKKQKKSKLNMSWVPDDKQTQEQEENSSLAKLVIVTTPVIAEYSKPQKTKPSKPGLDDVSCPVCFGVPFHLRCMCPIILAGSDAIERRLLELRGESPGKKTLLINELEGLLKQDVGTRLSSSSSNVAFPSFSTTTPSVANPLVGVLADTPRIPSPALSAAHSLPSWTPMIPVGSQISEVTVETAEEGSSTDSSSDSDSDDSNEPIKASRPGHVRKDAQSGHRPLPGPSHRGPYDDVDLDALLRGPSFLSRGRGLLSVLPEESASSEEERENVTLEEEDEEVAASQKKGYMKKKKVASSPSWSEMSDGEPDQALESVFQPVDTRVAVEKSDQMVDSRGESVSTDRRGDDAVGAALADDDADLRIALDQPEKADFNRSFLESPSFPFLVTQDTVKDSDLLLSQTSSGEKAICTLQGLSDDSELNDTRLNEMSSLAVLSPSGLQISSRAPPNELDTMSQRSEVNSLIDAGSDQTDIAADPLPAVTGENLLHADDSVPRFPDDRPDPIESSDDLLKQSGETEMDPIETDSSQLLPVALSPSKVASPGMIKRMRDRSGKLLSPTPVSRVLFSSEEPDVTTGTSTTNKRRTRAVKATVSLESVARRTRSATRMSTISLTPDPSTPPPDTVLYIPPSVHATVDRRSRAKLPTAGEMTPEIVEEEQHSSGPDATNASESLPTTEELSVSVNAVARPPLPSVSRRPSLLSTPQPSGALLSRAAPSSLAQWATLPPPTPSSVASPSSPVVDELVPSSPEKPQKGIETPATDDFRSEIDKVEALTQCEKNDDTSPDSPLTAGQTGAVDIPSFEKEFCTLAAELYFPGSSQVLPPLDSQPVPTTVDGAGMNRPASPAPSSSTEPETQMQQNFSQLTQRSFVPFRKLSDIASQQSLFSRILNTTPTPTQFSLKPVAHNNGRGTFGKEGQDDDDDDEDEDDADDSGSDTDDSSKARVPKERRAGAITSGAKKMAGLLSFV